MSAGSAHAGPPPARPPRQSCPGRAPQRALPSCACDAAGCAQLGGLRLAMGEPWQVSQKGVRRQAGEGIVGGVAPRSSPSSAVCGASLQPHATPHTHRDQSGRGSRRWSGRQRPPWQTQRRAPSRRRLQWPVRRTPRGDGTREGLGMLTERRKHDRAACLQPALHVPPWPPCRCRRGSFGTAW